MWAKIGDDKIWEFRTVTLLGITIENKLKFEEHIRTKAQEGTKETYNIDENKKIPGF